MINIKNLFSIKEYSVIEVTIKQAELFLSEFGSFYPFGTILTCKGEIKPVSGYIGEDDHPDSNDIINLLYEALQKSIEQGDSDFAVICIDIYVNQTSSQEVIQKDAIELRVINKEMTWKSYYIVYLLSMTRKLPSRR